MFRNLRWASLPVMCKIELMRTLYGAISLGNFWIWNKNEAVSYFNIPRSECKIGVEKLEMDKNVGDKLSPSVQSTCSPQLTLNNQSLEQFWRERKDRIFSSLPCFTFPVRVCSTAARQPVALASTAVSSSFLASLRWQNNLVRVCQHVSVIIC